MQESGWQWKMSAREDNLGLCNFGNTTTKLLFFFLTVIFIYWWHSNPFKLVRAEDTQDWQETFIKWWRMLPEEGFLWQGGFPTVASHKSSLWGRRLDLTTSGRWFATTFSTAALILSCPGAFKFSLGGCGFAVVAHWVGSCHCSPVCHKPGGPNSVQDQREWHSIIRIRTGPVTGGLQFL